MKHLLFTMMFFVTAMSLWAQDRDSLGNIYESTADRLLSGGGKLLIGGYGEVHYNQPLSSETRYNGTLDVHRMVMLLGYNFNSRIQFISEIEYEHVNEVYIEQAFLQHKLTKSLSLRAGLMLIPMGIVNEYHEPTAFNGVERPVIDSRISPTTWREVGFGIFGNSIGASLKYQIYVVNGFNGYNGAGKLNGKDALRNGRQKGVNSYISAPNLTGRVEYYGLRGLNLGVSGYFGNTQSTLYNGISKLDEAALARADSSVAGISMLGLDARYTISGLQLRGQFYHTAISNTMQYNRFTAKDSIQNDLGSAMLGYYIEAAYDVLRFFRETKSELTPFVRFENYNTHFKTEGSVQTNPAYDNQIITAGVGYKPVRGAVVKVDIQFVKSQAATKFSKVFNAGIGIMF